MFKTLSEIIKECYRPQWRNTLFRNGYAYLPCDQKVLELDRTNWENWAVDNVLHAEEEIEF